MGNEICSVLLNCGKRRRKMPKWNWRRKYRPILEGLILKAITHNDKVWSRGVMWPYWWLRKIFLDAVFWRNCLSTEKPVRRVFKWKMIARVWLDCLCCGMKLSRHFRVIYKIWLQFVGFRHWFIVGIKVKRTKMTRRFLGRTTRSTALHSLKRETGYSYT